MIAVVLQFVVLYAPRVPPVGSTGLPVDKFVHAGAFALATAALIWAGVPRWVAISVMAAHAPLSELVQSRLLVDRSGDPMDVVADLVGVVLGVLAVDALQSRAPSQPDGAGFRWRPR